MPRKARGPWRRKRLGFLTEGRCKMAEMTKTASKVLEFLQDQRKGCIDNLKLLEDKRKKNNKQLGSFAYWVGWNLMQFIHSEFRLELLENIIQNVNGGVKLGITDDKLIAFLKEVRDTYVKTVMQYSGYNSTNQVANLIEDEKINVYRGLAGTSTLDTLSLTGLLRELECK